MVSHLDSIHHPQLAAIHAHHVSSNKKEVSDVALDPADRIDPEA